MRFQPLSIPLLALLSACGQTSEDSECWYCEDSGTTASATGSTATGTKSETDTKTDTKTGTFTGSASYNYAGSVDLVTGMGEFLLSSADLGCESTIEVVGVADRADCSSCDSAWTVSFGKSLGGPSPCTGTEDLFSNFDWGLGHADPNELWQDKGGGWDIWVDGFSEISGDTWTADFGKIL